jgi:hypothetical protein
MASEHDVQIGTSADARYYRVTAEGGRIVRIEASYWNAAAKRIVYCAVQPNGAVWRRVEREFRNPTPHAAAGKAPRREPGWRPTIVASKGQNK